MRIRHTFDVFIHVVGLNGCHCLCIGEAAKQFGGHLIDALVGALGAEDDGHQQLIDAAKLQLGAYLRHLLLEIGQYGVVTLLFLHNILKFLQRYEIIHNS